MKRPRARGRLLAWVLSGLVGLITASAPATSADAPRDGTAATWRGACYCRMGAELACAADLTERECDQRSRDGLCDEWFWLERLACWNWGYGG
jgi:hypothetical protein